MSQESKVLVLDLQSGISGDMFVAAAAALASCEEEIIALPSALGLDAVTVKFSSVLRSGIQGRHFSVLEGSLPAEHSPHHGHHACPAHTGTEACQTHTSHHAHSQDEAHSHSHAKGSEAGHQHSHAHAQEEASHAEHGTHSHRALSDILHLLAHAQLPATVRERAARMFRRLGEVEAVAHGIPLEDVHFHEVGAIDSIVDIVASALCIERLAPFSVYANPVCVGSGFVRCAHGSMPVPAPATEALLRGMPCFQGLLAGEWTTPTGALILHELQPSFVDRPLTFTAAAYGAGNKDPKERPNLLRLRLAQASAAATSISVPEETLVVIATDIDSSAGELLGDAFISEALLKGALDVVILQTIMKKGRPGLRVEVLAPPSLVSTLSTWLFSNTPTIGLRLLPVQRLALSRSHTQLTTPWGPVGAKAVVLPDGSTRVRPEFESCRELAAKEALPVMDVWIQACAAAHRPASGR